MPATLSLVIMEVSRGPCVSMTLFLRLRLLFCTSMIIVALFTIAKLWKHPRCPTNDEWIKKMWYLYTMEFFSVTKKELNLVIHK
jgi:hypothetical protein